MEYQGCIRNQLFWLSRCCKAASACPFRGKASFSALRFPRTSGRGSQDLAGHRHTSTDEAHERTMISTRDHHTFRAVRPSARLSARLGAFLSPGACAKGDAVPHRHIQRKAGGSGQGGFHEVRTDAGWDRSKGRRPDSAIILSAQGGPRLVLHTLRAPPSALLLSQQYVESMSVPKRHPHDIDSPLRARPSQQKGLSMEFIGRPARVNLAVRLYHES